MRNHYIVRYEVAGIPRMHTHAITLPVDSMTTADDVLRMLQDKVVEARQSPTYVPPIKRDDVRFHLISLVHQTT